MAFLAMNINAAVNGYLELTLLKGRQRFDAISTLNLEVHKCWDWWIFTLFLSMVNLYLVNFEARWILNEQTFYCFIIVFIWKWILTWKNKSAWWIVTQLYFHGGESWPNCYGKKWTDGESWSNNFIEKVNRGEDLRWVGSRCPLMHA